MTTPERIVVVGLGRIGGSLAAAWRRAGHAVTGVERDADRRRLARARGIVDATATLESVAADADVVVVALAATAAARVGTRALASMRRDALLLDTSSTRGVVQASLDAVDSPTPRAGFHPIAGGGDDPLAPWNADAFAGRTVALVPGRAWTPQGTARAEALAAAAGARLVTVDARLHDDVLAATSHLPLAVGLALTETLDALAHEHGWPTDTVRALVGGQWRDVTRRTNLAPEVLADILSTNAPRVAETSAAFGRHLEELLAQAVRVSRANREAGSGERREREAADAGGSSALRERIARIARRREAWC